MGAAMCCSITPKRARKEVETSVVAVAAGRPAAEAHSLTRLLPDTVLHHLLSFIAVGSSTFDLNGHDTPLLVCRRWLSKAPTKPVAYFPNLSLATRFSTRIGAVFPQTIGLEIEEQLRGSYDIAAFESVLNHLAGVRHVKLDFIDPTPEWRRPRGLPTAYDVLLQALVIKDRHPISLNGMEQMVCIDCTELSFPYQCGLDGCVVVPNRCGKCVMPSLRQCSECSHYFHLHDAALCPRGVTPTVRCPLDRKRTGTSGPRYLCGPCTVKVTCADCQQPACCLHIGIQPHCGLSVCAQCIMPHITRCAIATTAARAMLAARHTRLLRTGVVI